MHGITIKFLDCISQCKIEFQEQKLQGETDPHTSVQQWSLVSS